MLLIGGTDALTGAVDGVNTTYVAAQDIAQDAVVAINGLVRQPGDGTSNGYRLLGTTLVLSEPLVPGDTLTVHLPQAPAPLPPGGLIINPGGPRPTPGDADLPIPSGSAMLSGPPAASGAATVLRPTLGVAYAPQGANPGVSGTAQVVGR